MNPVIKNIHAIEILDSRGNPTIRTAVTLETGVTACASIPSGASTGAAEAVELRDGDSQRYGGRGVRRAIRHVNQTIRGELIGRDVTRQAEIDHILQQLDGTEEKSKLGANATLSVSQACARVATLAVGLPLYRYLGGTGAVHLPMPMFNVLNGGKHADNGLDFQEFMLVPVGAPTFAEALRYGAQIFHVLAAILRGRGYSASVGDEGGFAPRLERDEQACELIVEAIEASGFTVGTDVAIALDPAATSFYENGAYHLTNSAQGRKTSSDVANALDPPPASFYENGANHLTDSVQGRKSSSEMIRLYGDWIEKYPIVSIEDGLAENDWAGFRDQTAALGKRVQIVGDDLLVTNTRFIARAIREKACNAVLIKLNQVGTVTETTEAIHLCRQAGWGFVISHRSGETEDSFIADLAVAMGGGQIKAGSVCRGERIVKYNRLLEIEEELGSAARFSGWMKSER